MYTKIGIVMTLTLRMKENQCQEIAPQEFRSHYELGGKPTSVIWGKESCEMMKTGQESGDLRLNYLDNSKALLNLRKQA